MLFLIRSKIIILAIRTVIRWGLNIFLMLADPIYTKLCSILHIMYIPLDIGTVCQKRTQNTACINQTSHRRRALGPLFTHNTIILKHWFLSSLSKDSLLVGF